MKFLCLLFCLLVFATPSLAENRTFIRCEYTEIIDRVDNDGAFPREMLPDCFPSKFDMMCKRTGVRFFAIDDKKKTVFAFGHLEMEFQNNDRFTAEKIRQLFLTVNEHLHVGYGFNRITGEFWFFENNLGTRPQIPKHTITQNGECKKINPAIKF